MHLIILENEMISLSFEEINFQRPKNHESIMKPLSLQGYSLVLCGKESKKYPLKNLKK